VWAVCWKARALRIVQCREGWHLGEEPNFTPEPPSEDHKALLTLRADLVAAYREAEGSELTSCRTRSGLWMRSCGRWGCGAGCLRSTCRRR
jgi:hypothetical protein